MSTFFVLYLVWPYTSGSEVLREVYGQTRYHTKKTLIAFFDASVISCNAKLPQSDSQSVSSHFSSTAGNGNLTLGHWKTNIGQRKTNIGQWKTSIGQWKTNIEQWKTVN